MTATELGHEYTTGGTECNRETVRVVRAGILNSGELEEFVGGDSGRHPDGGEVIATEAGGLRYKVGDFIVKFPDGSFQAVTEAAFTMFYRRPRKRY